MGTEEQAKAQLDWNSCKDLACSSFIWTWNAPSSKVPQGSNQGNCSPFFYKAMYHPSSPMRFSRTPLLLALFHLGKKKRKKQRPRKDLLKVEVMSQDRKNLEEKGKPGRRCSRRKAACGRMKRGRNGEDAKGSERGWGMEKLSWLTQSSPGRYKQSRAVILGAQEWQFYQMKSRSTANISPTRLSPMSPLGETSLLLVFDSFHIHRCFTWV